LGGFALHRRSTRNARFLASRKAVGLSLFTSSCVTGTFLYQDPSIRRKTVFRSLTIAAGMTAFVLSCAAFAQAQAQKPISRADFVAKVDASFNALDTNHDGFISLSEVQAGQNHDLQQVEAQRKAQIEARFRQLDTNKDGQLSLAEFSAAFPDVKPTETPQQILQNLDTNHDGKISAAEFRAPQLKKFNAMDLNHDGVITPDEVRKAVSAAQQQKK
jgi:Ca2+-binding EF-hand superfamily protein